MSSPMRLGIVGFGRLARNYYLPALSRMNDVAIVRGVADPNETCRATAVKLLPGVAIFESQSQMLDRESLDGILVASPPAAHLDALRQIIHRPNLAIFMEKPLVAPGQLAGLHEIPQSIRERVMVNFNRRFWHRYQEIARRSRQIGLVHSAKLELQVDVSKWLSVTSHRIEAGNGGALYDLGSQMIDLAGFIMNDRPSLICAAVESRRWEADHVLLDLAFSNSPTKVRCQVAYDSPTRERIGVHGSDGMIRIENPNMAVHHSPRSAITSMRDLFTFAAHAARRHTSMSRMTIELALRAFVGSWRNNRPMSPGFGDGLFNASALEAAARSANRGQAESIGTIAAEAIA